MYNFNLIFNKIKQTINAKTDADIARALGISPQALFAFKKQKKFPFELLINYCLNNKISIDWLFETKIENNVTNTQQEIIENDNNLLEIILWLKKNPQDKDLFLKLINCKKGIIEVFEAFKNFENYTI